MQLTLGQIAATVGGTIAGDADVLIRGVAPIQEAGEGDLTFVANPKYTRHIAATRAAAIVCAPDVAAPDKNLLKVDNPYLVYARIIARLYPGPREPGTIDSRAAVSDDAVLGENVTVYPFVYIGPGCTLGDNVTVHPHCCICRGVTIGAGSLLHPGVTIREGCTLGRRVIVQPGAVIGSDGFGFARDGARYVKIPQVGSVELGDDVEVGACATIDRAALERTEIKRGTKIDNLVQIAHNVVIGEDSAIVAQVGISGSTTLGDRVTVAGQAATVGHIHIGDDVIVGARGAVSADVPAGEVVSGTPHMPHKLFLKTSRIIRKLPEMRATVMELERKVAALERELTRLTGETS